MAARLTAYVVVAIVAATLIAGLIVGAQRDDNDGPVDLIVQNATVYTADRRATMAEAVAIRGNQILRVGSNREIARFQRPQTIVVDAAGGAVLPGFNDAHVDLAAGGRRLEMADLSAATTIAELLDTVGQWSAAHPEAKWVVGGGWSAELFKAGAPTRQQLDSVVRDRPAIMYAAGEAGAQAWVNTQALRAAGITRKTEDPVNGMIARETRGREPSGVLRGSAVALVASLIPQPTLAERDAALRAAIGHANALGITTAQNTAASCDRDLALYDAIRRAGDLTLRVYCTSALTPHAIATERDLAAYDDLRKKYPDDPLFKVGALSIVLDGTVPSRSAALLEPYNEREDAGEALADPDELNRAVRLADAAGWQVVTRATGDRAVRMALNAYAHAVRSNRPPAHGRRHRIEHLGLVDAGDLRRFGPLGVLASMQPLAVPSSGDPDVEPLAKILGPERAARVFPLADVAAETRLLLGSGWPSHPLAPLAALDRAVNRRARVDSSEAGAAAPAPALQRLPLKAAIDAYTSSAAWASFDEQRKGSISPGMLADLVVLSDDVLAAPAKLATAAVTVTIFDGKIVYRKGTHQLTEPAPSLQ